MPDQFVVPQFLDIESKIIGPITARQFLIILATILVEFIIFSIFLSVVMMLLLGLPVLVIGITFAFAKVNGRPFHYIALNMLQTLRRPGLRVWDKTLTDADVRARLKKKEEAPPEFIPHKKPLELSKLSELSLVVNTGGVYEPEESDILLKIQASKNQKTKK